MTFEWPRRDAVSPLSPPDLCTSRLINSDQIRLVYPRGKGVLPGWQPRPHPKERDPTHPSFWHPCVRRYCFTYSDAIRHINHINQHCMRRSNQILQVDHISWSTSPPDPRGGTLWDKTFVSPQRMLIPYDLDECWRAICLRHLTLLISCFLVVNHAGIVLRCVWFCCPSAPCRAILMWDFCPSVSLPVSRPMLLLCRKVYALLYTLLRFSLWN